MAEQHKRVFAAIGLPAEDIETLETITEEQIKEFDASGYAKKITGAYETKFLNDNSFLEKIPINKIPASARQAFERGQYERFLTEMKAVATELEIPVDELSEDEQRSIKNFYRGSVQKYFQKKGGNQTITELQNKYQKALADLDTAKKESDGRITAAVEKEQIKVNGVFEKMIVLQELSGISDLNGTPAYIVDTVVKKLNSKYHPIIDPDTFEISLMQKANKELNAINQDGTSISLAQALKQILEADKMIKPKKADNISTTTTTVIIDDTETRPIQSHVSKKIQQAIDAEKKSKISGN